MSSSPLSASPYEVLGVPPTATEDELKLAFRRALRRTHPDTGGDPEKFAAVQRAWERVGSAQSRAAYDAGRSFVEDRTFAPSAPTPRADSRPKARSHGHPGGWRRERYLVLLREWVGRGVEIDDPYDPVLVRSAPREIRHMLADAIAEETTARALTTLGIGFTIWHDVATRSGGKIDHVVLGPTGLYALQSEDFGGPVRIKRGELIGEAVAGAKPAHELADRARSLARALKVSFTGAALVLPDAALESSFAALGSHRGIQTMLVRSSSVLTLLREGAPSTRPIGGNELFDVRTRLQSGIQFV